jgi:hypothetical protein
MAARRRPPPRRVQSFVVGRWAYRQTQRVRPSKRPRRRRERKLARRLLVPRIAVADRRFKCLCSDLSARSDFKRDGGGGPWPRVATVTAGFTSTGGSSEAASLPWASHARDIMPVPSDESRPAGDRAGIQAAAAPQGARASCSAAGALAPGCSCTMAPRPLAPADSEPAVANATAPGGAGECAAPRRDSAWRSRLNCARQWARGTGPGPYWS